MSESPSEERSPKESIGRGENQCNAYNAYNAYNNNSEKRDNHCIRLRPSIHKAVKEYCGRWMSLGQFYEEAAILFMDLNPNDRVLLIVEKTERPRTSMKDRMLTILCVQELKNIIPALNRLHENKRKIPKITLNSLSKTFNKCYKITSPTDELNALIEEALRYVE